MVRGNKQLMSYSTFSCEFMNIYAKLVARLFSKRATMLIFYWCEFSQHSLWI